MAYKNIEICEFCESERDKYSIIIKEKCYCQDCYEKEFEDVLNYERAKIQEVIGEVLLNMDSLKEIKDYAKNLTSDTIKTSNKGKE